MLERMSDRTGMTSQTTYRNAIEERRSAGSGLLVKASETFVDTTRVHEVTERALTYLSVGYPVHIAGPAGTGKTTLAFHIAELLGRPVSLIHGNDEFGSSDLIGRDAGYCKSTLVDNYVHSVLKTEEKLDVHWIDNRLTTACEEGHTLIYDEFNRTPPEANNMLLSILEERILNMPKRGGGDGYLRVHPNFRAILTSNPEEYAGVHKTQDALLDRLITIQVDHYDQQTEESITAAKSGLDEQQVGYIVHIARALRAIGETPHRPTIRACIAVAKVVAKRGATAHPDDAFFRAVSFDILCDGRQIVSGGQSPAVSAAQQHELLLREIFEARRRGDTTTREVLSASPGAKARARAVRAP